MRTFGRHGMAVKKSPMERFAATNPESEIWWDSSPLVFESWKKKTQEETPADKRAMVAAWHERYYVSGKPMEQLFRGVTTNPPLSWAAVKDDPGFWREWAIEQKRRDPKLSAHDIWWLMYREIVKRGAEKYLGVFHRSGFRWGYLSGQVDPRDYENEEAMRSQALQIAGVASNIMIKVPGTAEGVRVIRYLTSRGISTNATLCFVLPQFVTVAEAVREGVEEAKRKGVDLSRWRSVITTMSARYEEMGYFEREGEKLGIQLTEAERRWSSIAILKKAINFLLEGKFPSKMLVASMRPGPVVDGKKKLWHFEKVAGADMVYTCPGKFIKLVDELGEEIEFDPDAWKEPVPEEVIEKLNRFEYFREAYDPHGLAHEEFNRHPSTVATATEFSGATNEMEKFVEESVRGADIKSKVAILA
jgi:transaldolase